MKIEITKMDRQELGLNVDINGKWAGWFLIPSEDSEEQFKVMSESVGRMIANNMLKRCPNDIQSAISLTKDSVI